MYGPNRDFHQPEHERRQFPTFLNNNNNNNSSLPTTAATTPDRSKDHPELRKLFQFFNFVCINNTNRSHGMFNSQRLLKKIILSNEKKSYPESFLRCFYSKFKRFKVSHTQISPYLFLIIKVIKFLLY